MSQKQDLTLFQDGSILPVAQLKQNILCLITSSHGTHPSWLVNALIENALFDTCYLNHDKAEKYEKAEVVVISFMNDKETYARNLKKIGVETEKSNFTFIDLFTDFFLNHLTVKQIIEEFERIDALLAKKSSAQPKCVFIEGIEFLLSATSITPYQLLQYLFKFNSHPATSLFLISSIDKELITVKQNSQDTPEFKNLDFLTKLFHRSNIILNLKPLETGRAKDVTGTLTITNGGIPSSVLEKEYLFLVSKDSTKLFYR